MGGTQDKRPWSGKGPDEVQPGSEVPAGQDPAHPRQPVQRRSKDSEVPRRREEDMLGEDDALGGYDEL
ncbi:hypothetical protein [Streptomyces subrutilus]|uniref:Uncharacterized protein n=1 Tax=Streptomyces subrutilus TaxID=36818 RepID=A0A1E5PL22_9ACTN|nr:hypothetical protein [Streptomyces subrutilus]OEJ30266.1 hypothetical protein BGK67_01845 [Streptomyces subrutilus]